MFIFEHIHRIYTNYNNIIKYNVDETKIINLERRKKVSNKKYKNNKYNTKIHSNKSFSVPFNNFASHFLVNLFVYYL